VKIRLRTGEWVEARCGDISLGGAFLETPHALSFGSSVELAFELPDLDHDAIVPAVVRWTKPGGMGVQFCAMGARETHGLVTLLAGVAARVA
jgi:type IV pilus assembly protein PilZ